MKVNKENLCVRPKETLKYQDYSMSMVDEFVER